MELEDSYGGDSAHCYQLFAESLERTPLAPDYLSALERGLRVSLRDDDRPRARWFAGRLAQIGHNGGAFLLGSRPEPADVVMVPGGIKAIMSMLRGNEQEDHARFAGRYARMLVEIFPTLDATQWRQLTELLTNHFRLISKLESYGRRDGTTVSISLSVRDGAARNQAAQVLDLFGWNLRSSRRGVRIEGADRGSAAQRRYLGTALGIDEIEMAETLQSGRPFQFKISDDPIPILFGEDPWRQQFYPENDLAGGFVEGLMRNPSMAKLYVGLEALDCETAAALIREVGWKQLTEKYADLLWNYSAALAVFDNRVAVPGGDDATGAWEQVVGAGIGSPGAFFHALFDQDHGSLLAFYFNLAQLDAPHQRYFTRSASRIRRYYEVFRDTPELQFNSPWTLRVLPLTEFLRRIPLDAAGHVRFPGGAGTWADYLGNSVMAREPSLPPAADAEDHIMMRLMMRLMQTLYTTPEGRKSALCAFIAVCALESHRLAPLDSGSVRVLAAEFQNCQPVWPYFAILNGLGFREFRGSSALREQVRNEPALILNDRMGSFHALVELTCLLKQAGRSIGEFQIELRIAVVPRSGLWQRTFQLVLLR